MADATITVVLTQLGAIIEKQIRKELRLVVGVGKDVQKLTATFKAIQAVLVDAENQQVKQESVKLWLERLRDITYDTDDVLTEWATAILKHQIEVPETSNKKKLFISFPCFPLNRVLRRRDIALKIKDIREKLDAINTEKDKYGFSESGGGEEYERIKSTSSIDVSFVRGRDEDKNNLVRKLCESCGGLEIISIVGLGGIGKTTLAQFVFNSNEVEIHFEKRIWVCVSEPFEEMRVAKAIVEEVKGKTPNVVELQTALRHVGNCIAGKKFLLVLDDVWTEDDRKWEPLLNSLMKGAPGSKVLVTTRNERVSKMMGTTSTHHLGRLSDGECWSLFSKKAFFGRSASDFEELKPIGRKISDKCKGLPLTARIIGSLMPFKKTLQDWEGVLGSDIWELEVAEKRLFPPLLLSYSELPPAIKRCFSYCANFPKDYKIESDKLIKMWMAQGYLSTKGSAEMEITGQEYLENLIMRSFFQDLEKDKDEKKVIRFKMHDMVHDLAQYLTRNECYIMESHHSKQMKDSTFRHLTIVRGEDPSLPVPPANSNTERLHTFWVQSFHDSQPIVSETDEVPTSLFLRMKFLKVLDLSRNRLLELPKEVEKLMNLRYLNLSDNPLRELPDTVCDLCNLQTLKLSACNHLRKLPQGVEKLINLRHLEIDRTEDLRELPKGIRSLTTLRTLSKFVISGGGDTAEGACKLGDLENLDNLRGCLKIEGLGFVEDSCEAQKARLMNKEHVVDLQIDFSHLESRNGRTDVFEVLELPTNLQCLQVKLYGGTQFPNWMVSLTSLRSLRLQDCQNCVILPSLGKLPSLETLNIESMDSLKVVGHEFLESSSSVITFPKLKKLKIVKMRSWEEWNVRDGVITIMPCLRYLQLSHCEKLKKLPDPLLQVTSLKKLRIYNSPILQQRYQKGVGDDWEKISHIPKSRISRK